MTDQDRIEGAKLICEFMGWKYDEKGFYPNGCVGYIQDIRQEFDYLVRDRNLLHEVLTEIEERGHGLRVMKNLLHRMEGCNYEDVTGFDFLTADPETIFDAIVATLEGEVE